MECITQLVEETRVNDGAVESYRISSVRTRNLAVAATEIPAWSELGRSPFNKLRNTLRWPAPNYSLCAILADLPAELHSGLDTALPENRAQVRIHGVRRDVELLSDLPVTLTAE